MYFGEPFDVGNGMKVYIPTIGDILQLPNSDITFYQTLNIWVANTTSYRLMLWDNGIDWNKISDYELFLFLFKGGDPLVNKLLFGEDNNFDNFEIFQWTHVEKDENDEDVEKKETVLYNAENEIVISEKDYSLISDYLRAAFNIYPKVEKAKGRATKEAIIDEERMNLRSKKKEENDEGSTLLPLISSCINHPGFKYNMQQLKDVNMVQFMDSVYRLQIYENTVALLRGSMSGFVDTSKINKDEFNFMRAASHK